MPATSSSPPWKTWLVCSLLLLSVYAVFGQTTRYAFTAFDDNDYVYQNPFVARGLTFRGILWAFTHVRARNWHPLTWVSHMLDCQWFGLNAGPHHATNMILHGISACLLFLLLRRLSKALWPSALVAAIFAVHPLHVESVAWVAERKDVLSGLFFFLTLLAYESYVRHDRSIGRYLLATLLFALGLMAKPMLVTLPLVVLLLDYWPLGRFREEQEPATDAADETAPGANESRDSTGWKRALRNRLQVVLPPLMEKLPWLFISAASCAITVAAQKKSILSMDRLPLAIRLPNAMISYVAYLQQAVWPQGLAVFYPNLEKSTPWTTLIGITALLAGISWGVLHLRRRCPYLLVGWLWYVGMLLPVIGLVQVGNQAMADRYTYLPLIGISLGVVWAARDFVARWPRSRGLATVVATILLTTSLVAAWRQTTFWRDDLTLWRRVAACTAESAKTLNNLGKALDDAGQGVEAARNFQRAVEIQPACSTAHFNHGLTLAAEGKLSEAIAEVTKAVELEPDWSAAHNKLAWLLSGQRRWREVIDHLQRGLESDPNDLVIRENLAWTLATIAPDEGGDPQRAIALAEQACRLIPSPDVKEWDVLAVAYAADGRFADAEATAERALKIAVAQGKAKRAAEIRDRIKLYQAGKPYRQ